MNNPFRRLSHTKDADFFFLTRVIRKCGGNRKQTPNKLKRVCGCSKSLIHVLCTNCAISRLQKSFFIIRAVNYRENFSIIIFPYKS